MRRPSRCWLAVFAVLSVTTAMVAPPARAAAVSTDTQIKAEVERKIAGLRLGSSRVMVSVHDHVVMLDGTLPTLWLKRQVIERARKTDGVQEVDSTLEIARAENDVQLAASVSKELREYPRYTVYDFVDGGVHNAIVTLTGAVTEPAKSAEITERVERIPGVREINNTITVLPVSQMDDRIRVRIATEIYTDPLFGNYSRATPPIHVIVETGHVTLVGIVASDVERRKAELIARAVPGVFSVDDKLRLESELRGE